MKLRIRIPHEYVHVLKSCSKELMAPPKPNPFLHFEQFMKNILGNSVDIGALVKGPLPPPKRN